VKGESVKSEWVRGVREKVRESEKVQDNVERGRAR
jgi:hypothetical protein